MPVCKRTCWSSDISMPASMPRQRPCTGSCKAGAVVDLTCRAPSAVPTGGHAHCCLPVPPGLPPTPALRTFWPFWPELPLARAHTRVPFCTCSDTGATAGHALDVGALDQATAADSARAAALSLSIAPRCRVFWLHGCSCGWQRAGATAAGALTSDKGGAGGGALPSSRSGGPRARRPERSGSRSRRCRAGGGGRAGGQVGRSGPCGAPGRRDRPAARFVVAPTTPGQAQGAPRGAAQPHLHIAGAIVPAAGWLGLGRTAEGGSEGRCGKCTGREGLRGHGTVALSTLSTTGAAAHSAAAWGHPPGGQRRGSKP